MAVRNARNQQPEEFKDWTEAIRQLSKEDRYILVMIKQAGVGATCRASRSSGDMWKRLGAGFKLVALFGSFVWFIDRFFPDTSVTPAAPRGRYGFPVWVAMVCVAVGYSLSRFVMGAQKFDDMYVRVVEWFFGASKRRR